MVIAWSVKKNDFEPFEKLTHRPSDGIGSTGRVSGVDGLLAVDGWSVTTTVHKRQRAYLTDMKIMTSSILNNLVKIKEHVFLSGKV